MQRLIVAYPNFAAAQNVNNCSKLNAGLRLLPVWHPLAVVAVWLAAN